ncbi:CapA family protein [Pleomorphovibrio marinus]|uniref:CapA family protein n=1 Tax=Pleomorphovibrio marinus TaxID=2164132 RepID=UPI000E0B9735|nr:CapA family protein [Pleomorphovibrio marinus]
MISKGFISLVVCLLHATLLNGQTPDKEVYRQNEVGWDWKTQAQEADLVIFLMGDTNIQDRENPVEAFTYLLPTLKQGDLRFLNLEGPFSGKGDTINPIIPHKKLWTHSDVEQVSALVDAGIDGVGVANNVTYPAFSLLRSLEVLDSVGIGYTGGGINQEEAHRPIIFDKKGTKVGFIQYSTLYWPYGHAATEEEPGIAALKVHTYYQPPKQVLDKPGQPPIIVTIPDEMALKRMEEDIRALKEKVDVAIISFHWGVSNSEEVAQYQRTLGRAAIDAGADLVMGHGPHVLQPIEIWKGKPLFLSVGNAVFDWWKLTYSREGLLVRVLVKNKKVEGVEFVPLIRDQDNWAVLLDPNEGLGAELFEKVKEISEDTPLRLIGKTINIDGLE